MAKNATHIQSISAGYSIEEDRVLLRIETAAGVDLYWVTRRAMSMLVTAIGQVLERQYLSLGVELKTPHVHELASFAAEAVSKAMPLQPATEESIAVDSAKLLHGIEFAVLDHDECVLALKDRLGNRGVFACRRDALHGLANLLDSKVTQAGWGEGVAQIA